MREDINARLVPPGAELCDFLICQRRRKPLLVVLYKNLGRREPASLRAPYRDAPLLQKPFQLGDLENVFLAVFSASGA